MDSEIVYLRLNSLTEDGLFLVNLLGTIDPIQEEICIYAEVMDQSLDFWITCKKSWIDKNCPKILESVKEPEHYDWRPENYGYHFSPEDL